MRLFPFALMFPLIGLRCFSVSLTGLVASGALRLTGADGGPISNPYASAPALVLALGNMGWCNLIVALLAFAAGGWLQGHPRARAAATAAACLGLAESLVRVVAAPVLYATARDWMAGPFGATSVDDVCCCLPLNGLASALLLATVHMTRSR